MEDAVDAIAAFVDASALVLEMPLAGEERAAVIAAMTRIAAFAADVVAFPLTEEVGSSSLLVP